jgi:hypothetical protein
MTAQRSLNTGTVHISTGLVRVLLIIGLIVEFVAMLKASGWTKG